MLRRRRPRPSAIRRRLPMLPRSPRSWAAPHRRARQAAWPDGPGFTSELRSAGQAAGRSSNQCGAQRCCTSRACRRHRAHRRLDTVHIRESSSRRRRRGSRASAQKATPHCTCFLERCCGDAT